MNHEPQPGEWRIEPGQGARTDQLHNATVMKLTRTLGPERT